MSVLRLDQASRHFGRKLVLDQISLDVTTGEKVGLLGANGSGKTTLLRLAAGILRPTSGTVASERIHYVPQDAPVYPELTAAEHLRFSCQLHGQTPDEGALGDLAHQPAGALSRGQRQRLHLEMALQSGADVLLLDEPFTALDEAAVAWLESALQHHAGAIVMSLHDSAQANQICDRTVHLEVQ